ncbi:glycolipid transfer protein-like isoform X2 [Ischnura elegans]|nr:glycolipid transfer protein-like isoform X2 [Ischnura elegans]
MGNIQKLRRKYEEDKSRFIYLNDMILAEKDQGEYMAIGALLWLRRGLELFYVFFTLVVQQTEAGNASEDLRPLLQQAYQETLEKYHGWMSKQLFKLVCQMSPCRKDFMLALALGQEGRESSVISHISSFVVDLRHNTGAVYKLYEDNGIDLEAKS